MENNLTDDINGMIFEAKQKKLISTKDISDGYHTFGNLYNHRIALFCVICNSYPELSWKSKKHFDEENDPMFNSSFVAGITTPLGEAIYHIKLDYWDEFDIPEIERSPVYDGHTSDDTLIRLKSLGKNSKSKGR